MTGCSIEQMRDALSLLQQGMISANTYMAVALPTRRKGFGSTAKLMRKRAKQFSKKEARQWRRLMREVRP